MFHGLEVERAGAVQALEGSQAEAKRALQLGLEFLRLEILLHRPPLFEPRVYAVVRLLGENRQQGLQKHVPPGASGELHEWELEDL